MKSDCCRLLLSAVTQGVVVLLGVGMVASGCGASGDAPRDGVLPGEGTEKGHELSGADPDADFDGEDVDTAHYKSLDELKEAFIRCMEEMTGHSGRYYEGWGMDREITDEESALMVECNDRISTP